VRLLPASVQDAVRSGTLCPYAAMKALVPLARANKGHCERLTASLVASGERLSSRLVERLYGAYRAGPAEVRENIVANPMLFLRVDKEVSRPDPPEPPVASAALVKAVEGLGGLARRTRSELKKLPPGALDPGSLDLIRSAWTETHSDLHVLSTRFSELFDERSGNPRRDP
jgi:hypothetical protein